MTSEYIVEKYDHTPWVICHPDLTPKNIIADEEFNVTG